MPCHSLLSDRVITLSVGLAASIGLEEALLLTVLNDCARLQSQTWAKFQCQTLRQQVPFWQDEHIAQLFDSLVAKGLVQISGPKFGQAEGIIFNFATSPATRPTNPPSQVAAKSASVAATARSVAPINPNWQAQPDTLKRLEQHGIPVSFAMSQRDAFLLKAQEEGSSRNDWENRFFRYVKAQWVFANNDAQQVKSDTTFPIRVEEALPIQPTWQPRVEALEILQKAEVDGQFISDAVPEFVLYWLERGEVSKTWNNKFIQHVRTQWARYSAAEQYATAPVPIAENWRPSPDCFDIIAMAHIDRQFAESLIGEFVLYWRESNQVYSSWNSRFLQFVKQRWSARLTTGAAHGTQQNSEPGYATAAGIRQQLADTSW